jgi:hypothetical protein
LEEYKNNESLTHCNSYNGRGRSGDRIPVGGEIFRTRPYRPWSPPNLLYNGYRVSFPGAKRPGHGINHPPSSRAKAKGRMELYLYSHSGPSCPVVGRALPFFTVEGTRKRGRPCKRWGDEVKAVAREGWEWRNIILEATFHSGQ